MNNSTNYNSSLISLLKKLRNNISQLFCLGIDPSPKIIPSDEYKFTENAEKFIINTLEKLANANYCPGTIKPNAAYYLSLDRPRFGEFMGSRLLGRVLDACEKLFPDTTIILDYKTGDIDRSSEAMAKNIFHGWRVNATTVHPYMGSDSIKPYLQLGNAYILTRTSNPSAKELQDIQNANNEPLFKQTTNMIINLAKEFPGKVGAVVGATYPDELREIIQHINGYDVPLLIPGIGTQSGSLEEIIPIIKEIQPNPYLTRINNGSHLWSAWRDKSHPPENHVVDAIKSFIDKLVDSFDK